MSFWVYENTVHKKVRVHRADCSYCSDGHGVHGGGKTGSGEWFGPYETLDHAMQVADSRGQPDVRGCEVCVGREVPASHEHGERKRADSEVAVQRVSDAPVAHDVRLGLTWRLRGKIALDKAGKLILPAVPPSAGLYRFRLRSENGRSSVYIGESGNLSRRFANYRNPGPTQQTSLRINATLTRHIESGGEISVSVADGLSVAVRGVPNEIDLSVKSVRQLYESLAITLESADDVESLNR